MKSYIVGLMAIMMAIAPAMAATDLRVELQASGTTSFLEQATVGIAMFRHTIDVGTITENVFNQGHIKLVKEVTASSPAPFKTILMEGMEVKAVGTTMINKDVEWEDVWRHPTAASIFAAYDVPYSSDAIRVDNLGEGSFGLNLVTNDWLRYDESATVAHGLPAILNCEPEGPVAPIEPFCSICEEDDEDCQCED